MSFRRKDCKLPSLWCGNGGIPTKHPSSDSFYTQPGTRYDCLRKGFGAGKAITENKNINNTSLRNIKFVGERYEQRFRAQRVRNLLQLENKARKMTPEDFKRWLHKVLQTKGGKIDQRTYNSVLIYLDDAGIQKLPKCHVFSGNPSRRGSIQSHPTPNSEDEGSQLLSEEESTEEILL